VRLARERREDGVGFRRPSTPCAAIASKSARTEREERLVDVGPLVIPHPEAAKLTEPGKGALDDPPPPAQATPMRGAAHGQEGHDVTNPETAPNRRRVVAPIPSTQSGHCRGRPRAPCSGGIASTNARTSCESFRFARVRRTASGTPRPSQIRCRLLPRLARSGGIGTGLVTAVHRADGTTVHDRPRPINLVVACEPIQEREMD
jgi:hypothetical protein